MCMCICIYTYAQSIPLNVPQAETNTSSLSQGKFAVHFPVMSYVTYREFGQCVCEKCYVLNEKCSFLMLLHSMHHAKVLPKIV